MQNSFVPVSPTFTSVNGANVTQITYPQRSSVIDASQASSMVITAVVDVNTPASGTFTASATTDLLTQTAHGYHTGLVLQVSNSGGALPTGLSASTNYYVIRNDADTYYLATSLVNVNARSHIDITNAGSGTQTATPTALASGQFIVQGSYDQAVFYNVPNQTITISADATIGPLEVDYLRYPFYYIYATLASGMFQFTTLQVGLKTEAA